MKLRQPPHKSPTWRLHTRLCNFVLNISTNISALGQCTHLKLGKLSSLFTFCNITIFLLYPLHTFLFYFLLRDSAHTLLNDSVIQGSFNNDCSDTPDTLSVKLNPEKNSLLVLSTVENLQ